MHRNISVFFGLSDRVYCNINSNFWTVTEPLWLVTGTLGTVTRLATQLSEMIVTCDLDSRLDVLWRQQACSFCLHNNMNNVKLNQTKHLMASPQMALLNRRVVVLVLTTIINLRIVRKLFNIFLTFKSARNWEILVIKWTSFLNRSLTFTMFIQCNNVL